MKRSEAIHVAELDVLGVFHRRAVAPTGARNALRPGRQRRA